MVTSLNNEGKRLGQGLTTEIEQDVYASNYIDPQNKLARQRLIRDAVGIDTDEQQVALGLFHAELRFSDLALKRYGSACLKNFNSFADTYLSLLRDALGGLYSREEALEITSKELLKYKGLTEVDLKARQSIFSAHYLEEVERTLSIIEKLRPLALAASGVNKKVFDLDRLDDHFRYATGIIEDLCKEMNKENLPSQDELPQKPLTKNQKKKTKVTSKEKITN